MESSTLLKTPIQLNHQPTPRPANVRTTATTIATVIRPSPPDPDYCDSDGPYFDLEFSILEEEDEDDDVADSSSSSDSNDPSVSFSPSDHLFFTCTPNSKPPPPPLFPSSLLKSATKFRVFLLRFKRLKPKPKPHPDSPSPTKKKQQQQHNNKTYLVKLKVKELLLQDHASSRSSSSSSSNRSNVDDAMTSPAAEEKRNPNPKDVIHRYLNKIKPLSFHKPRFSSNLTDSKRLRKSRSASSAVSAVQSPPRPRCQRDDSLVEQEDGIQSAIAHCKRSFSAGRGCYLVLARSRSDPGF